MAFYWTPVEIARRSGLRPRGPLGCHTPHRLQRLVEPVAEEAAAHGPVEDAVLELERLHAEGGVDESAVLGLGEGPVDEGAGVYASDREVLAVLHGVDSQLHLVLASRGLDDLAVGATRLEPLALDGEDAGPPLRMA